jgi:hypothetical protein
MNEPTEEGGVLDEARLIESKLVANVLNVGLTGEQSGNDAGGVAW